MRVKIGFESGNRVTYKSCGERISAVIVAVHNETNVPGGYEYEIRITGYSRTYSKGSTFRTTGNYLSLGSNKNTTPKQDKRKRDNKEMKALQELSLRITKR